jgi:hypothetical protein
MADASTHREQYALADATATSVEVDVNRRYAIGSCRPKQRGQFGSERSTAM